MQKISTCLLFDTQAEEAAQFYTSVFKNSKIKDTTRYGDAGPMPKGTVMTVIFEIEGREFMALNCGATVGTTPAVSMMISCQNQQEIDMLWEKLTAEGGREIECGWLADKYGLHWQIIPYNLGELLTSANPRKTDNVMKAVRRMKKLDMQAMQDAYDAG